MIRLYKEHPEFNEYIKFDTIRGQTIPVSSNEFEDLAKLHPAFIGRAESTHTNFPRRVYFQITRRCNLFCDYCFIKADSNQPHLHTPIILNLAKFLGQNGLMEVRLTGGEPTIHPDFIKICQAFQENNVYVSIGTNGMWTPKIQEFLKQQRSFFIIVSIDGKKETHDYYRKNSYDTIIKNLLQLRSFNKDIRIRINTVLTQRSRHDLEDLCRLAESIQASNITLLPLRSQVRVSHVREERLNAREFKDVIEKMIEYKKRYKIQFTTALGAEFKNEIMDDNVFTRRSSCAAGREGTNLDFDATRKKMLMYACSYCPAPDLQDRSSLRQLFLAGEFDYDDIGQFKTIWTDNSRWTIFRDLSLKPTRCQTCNEFRTLCTGGCPVQNLEFSNININTSANVKEQIMSQMQTTSEWYCYKYLSEDMGE